MTIRKRLFFVGAVLVAIVIACILVYRMLGSGQVDPLALLVLAAVISIMLPMLRSIFLPSTGDCQAELHYHVQRQDAFVRRQIADKLGPDAAGRIWGGRDAGGETPTGYLLDLLANEEDNQDPDLRFALLIALARHREQTGDPGAAIGNLAEALRTRPQDFVARFSLAHNLEWLERPAEALAAYRQILSRSTELSRAMIKLTRLRMSGLEKR